MTRASDELSRIPDDMKQYTNERTFEPVMRADGVADASNDDSGPNEALERLISRFLDKESDASQRRELKRRTDREPAARALLDDYIALDREAGSAMHAALGRRRRAQRAAPLWFRIARTCALAAAACLAAMFFSATGLRTVRSDDPQRGSSLFEPPQWSDMFDGRRQPLPHIQNRDVERDWILIPSDKPNEYMVIEVDRVRTRTVGIHQDS